MLGVEATENYTRIYTNKVSLHILQVHVHARIHTCENIRSYRSIYSKGQIIDSHYGGCLELIENTLFSPIQRATPAQTSHSAVLNPVGCIIF